MQQVFWLFEQVLHLLLPCKDTQLLEIPHHSKALILERAVSVTHPHKHIHVPISMLKYLYRVTFQESLLLARFSISVFK